MFTIFVAIVENTKKEMSHFAIINTIALKVGLLKMIKINVMDVVKLNNANTGIVKIVIIIFVSNVRMLEILNVLTNTN